MPAPLPPGTYIEEAPSGVRTIAAVATSITLFVGWARRGPLDRALRIQSFADFERRYGGLHGDDAVFLGHALRHFFANGGSDAYIMRIVHQDAATAIARFGDLTVSANSPGAWANDFGVRITIDQATDAARFTLDVIQLSPDEAVLERFTNLSCDPADSGFAPDVINSQSAFVGELAFATESPVAPTEGIQPLTGGEDGPVLSPNDADFTAALAAAFEAGGIADGIDLINIICVPGLTDPDAIGALQTSACARRAFLIVDCPADAAVADVGILPPAITGTDARNSAFFFPWVRAADPLRANAARDFPPSGYVAGVMARTDATRGVWKAPAGIDATLSGALGLAIATGAQESARLNPLGINCLRTLPGSQTAVWGARTLHGDDRRGSEWKYVPVRRIALFLEESLYRGTRWVASAPNDEALWVQLRLNIGAFMQWLFRQGAFQGVTSREAYFVKCDHETITAADIDQGIVNIEVGFAPLKPAEFVVLRIRQIAGERES